jgi:hypothetical protein
LERKFETQAYQNEEHAWLLRRLLMSASEGATSAANEASEEDLASASSGRSSDPRRRS